MTTKRSDRGALPAADFDKRVTRRLRVVLAWCRKEHIDVTPGLEVSEAVAARIIGYGPDRGETLAVQRAEGRVSPLLRFRQLGRGYLYDLHSCAVFIEEKYDRMLDESLSRDAGTTK
ncbi:hypothetical protein [Paraburkholderia saeva]|uniref:hypothetical protein n=1 Tax=Paraburkholderia saeva TaxID=2777537 RepID=UPI001E3F14AB|nr:hypothetical protein [Paraburkholderia saeva]